MVIIDSLVYDVIVKYMIPMKKKKNTIINKEKKKSSWAFYNATDNYTEYFYI